MGMVVRTNTMAVNAYRQLNMNQTRLAKSLEKLASGFRINRAADDAAGLAISEKMKAQIVGLEAASQNSLDGISLVQTAEGALTEVHNMLNRMVFLATRSANGTFDDPVDRAALQAEVDSLLSEIDRISQSANFNGVKLLDGSLSGAPKGSNAVNAKVAQLITAFEKGGLKIGKGAPVAATGTEYTVDDIRINDLIAEMQSRGFLQGTVTKATFDRDFAAFLGVEQYDYNFSQITVGAGATNVIDTTVVGAPAAGAGDAVFEAVDAGAVDPNKSQILDNGRGYAYVSAEGTDAYNMVNLIVSEAGNDLSLIGQQIAVNGKTYTFVGDGDKTMDGTTLIVQSGDKLADGSYAIYIGATQTLADAARQQAIATEIATAINDVEDAASTWNPTTGLITPGGSPVIIATAANGVATIDQLKFPKVINNDVLPGEGLTLQIGDTNESFNKVTVFVDDLSAKGLGIDGLKISTQVDAGNAIADIKAAINQVSINRANLGALQNRLEYTINNLDVMAENMMAANSRIRDTDMAKEMMEYTKMNILVQAAQAMLAQANMQPQSILQLLQ